MQPFPVPPKPQVIFDVHQYPLSPGEEQTLRDSLDGLARQVAHFPVADLHILIEGNARTNGVTVKLSLVLPGTTLVVSDHHATAQPAFERSLDSLLDSLRAYKERLGQVPERQKLEKGTHQELHPEVAIDAAAVEEAVHGSDYPAFRTALLPYEEGVRKLVGRRVQRYPEFDAQIGRGVAIADIVEDVFLTAFEGYANRPADVPLGMWLQGRIEVALKALQQNRDAEMENIQMARAARAAVQDPNNI
jgi:ribosome-associated translation inhibitor RaiA